MDMTLKHWKVGRCVVFYRTRELNGDLSNMAGGMPCVVNGKLYPRSEQLYQACRFPHHPDIQADIARETNPMKSKWIARAHDDKTRSDWYEVREAIMTWTIRVKLAQNVLRFGGALRAVPDGAPIVERSRRDQFWGAVPHPTDHEILVGSNTLGIILGNVRRDMIAMDDDALVRAAPAAPAKVKDFLFMGELYLPWASGPI